MLSILRIMTGLLFLEHGLQKFLSFPAGKMAGFGWTFAGPLPTLESSSSFAVR
jgi:putative oxidoreductase